MRQSTDSQDEIERAIDGVKGRGHGGRPAQATGRQQAPAHGAKWSFTQVKRWNYRNHQLWNDPEDVPPGKKITEVRRCKAKQS